MNISILTFNLEYSMGFPKLLRVIDKFRPDILAVQEFELSDDSKTLIKEAGYELADYSESFKKRSVVYGVATFYNKKRMTLHKSNTIRLPRSYLEFFWFVFRGAPSRTFVNTTLKTKRGKKSINIFNVHFTPFARNKHRIKQLDKTLSTAQSAGGPTVVLGDFNYPYSRSLLEDAFCKYDFKEATTNVFHTFFKSLRYLNLRFKLDYVLYKDLKHVSTKQIDAFSTDHTPIISTFSDA